jgi:hypothetical protein
MNTANSAVYAPSGLRRLTPQMLETQRLGETFTGCESAPGKVLAAFKAAAPYLGFSPRVVHAVDWLFRFTQPQDWVPGSRPVVWPSAAMQCEGLVLSAGRVKAMNRHLAELGLISMKDSPTDKRYGVRNRAGHIIEAYGFDPSPIGSRVEEFLAVAAKGRKPAMPSQRSGAASRFAARRSIRSSKPPSSKACTAGAGRPQPPHRRSWFTSSLRPKVWRNSPPAWRAWNASRRTHEPRSKASCG